MSALNLLLLAAGIALIAIGYLRGRGPYERMRALEATTENIRRYETWRGGRSDPGGGTAAELMHVELRRQVRRWTGLAIAGFVLVFAGFLIR
ncbi:MAG TPA: hypothetical protein VGQ47_02870 [Candidatus Limnocylindrales bacterium]|nr:hypothetical protein [Candidatus Limnocylindrales bacterium]